MNTDVFPATFSAADEAMDHSRRGTGSVFRQQRQSGCVVGEGESGQTAGGWRPREHV